MRQQLGGGVLDIEGDTGEFRAGDQTYRIVASPPTGLAGRLRSSVGADQWWSISVTELATGKDWRSRAFSGTAAHAIWSAAFNIAVDHGHIEFGQGQAKQPVEVATSHPGGDAQIERVPPASASDLNGSICEGELIAGRRAVERGDYAAALKVFRPAAEQGEARSQCMLGLMYMEGWGVTQNYAEAAEWFKSAYRGDGGETDAAGLYLGELYCQGCMQHEGRSPRENFIQAYMWFILVAAHSSPGKVRDGAVYWRQRLEREKLTPAEVAEAQRLARDWRPPDTKPS